MSNKVDGFDHINIYSKGETELGRLLSNFAETEINTYHGKFHSVEAYWYYLQCSSHPMAQDLRDQLRTLTGYEAKKKGRELCSKITSSITPVNPIFRLCIASAIIDKLVRHEHLLKLFLENDLPFAHYYLSSSGKRVSGEGKWVIDIWTFIKKLLTSE